MGRTFDATSDVLTLPAGTPTLDGAAAGTVAMWVKPTWAKTDYTSHKFLDVSKDSNNFFRCEKYEDNSMYWGWRYRPASTTFTYRVTVSSGSYTWTQNAWNSIVYTWDDAVSTKQVLYINGSQVGTHTSLAYPNLTAAIRYVGNKIPTSSQDVRGDMAEFVICDYAWSARQIAAYSAKYSPLIMAPNFTCYIPLLGGLKEWKGIVVTDVGTANGSHPPVIYPFRLAA